MLIILAFSEFVCYIFVDSGKFCQQLIGLIMFAIDVDLWILFVKQNIIRKPKTSSSQHGHKMKKKIRRFCREIASIVFLEWGKNDR